MPLILLLRIDRLGLGWLCLWLCADAVQSEQTDSQEVSQLLVELPPRFESRIGDRLSPNVSEVSG